MTGKSKFEPSQDRTMALQASMRCEPLLARLDPLSQISQPNPSIACTVPTADGLSDLSLEYPLFTRIAMDAGLGVNVQRLLLSELKSFGIAWVGNSSDGKLGKLCRISPLYNDDPIDVETFQDAAAIELQLYGIPFRSLASSRRARWTPSLPIEVTVFEQLGKKTELLRVVSGGTCPIGAAICPGAVYDDVRFLIDCGFDYITLLTDVQHELSSACSLRLASLEPTLEQSMKAVQDSGAKTKILVSANLCDGFQMFRCLQMGAAAISIDAVIAKAKPTELTPTRDTIGSILSAHAPATASTLAWVRPAINKLIEEICDCAIYSGRQETH